MFNNVYAGKRVLVTGHTGFKGTWLSSWLLKLGAKVCGISDQIPTSPSMFEEVGLEQDIEHHFCDIRELDKMEKIVRDFKPDFLFHLAAQPIVSDSYADPLNTISTNVMGTAHVLDVLKRLDHNCCAVFITSDKCYENVEWEWGYKETDAVGGKDIYSGSKGAAEVIFHAYQQSFFKDGQNSHIRMATGRAGNVIGGGDWALDRIIVDCVRSWNDGNTVELRCPSATRPWQHVLEPLSGYLTLGQQLFEREELHGESFNFGPRAEQNRTVLDLMTDLSDIWGFDQSSSAYAVTDNVPFHEAGLLKLNCDQALFHMKWEAVLIYSECVDMVGEWYKLFSKGTSTDMKAFTAAKLSKYEELAKERSIVWTK